MATVEDVARHVAGVTQQDADMLLLATWINQRWKELAATTTLKSLRVTGEFATVPVLNEGTVDVTRDSVEVTGTGTPWTSHLVGRVFRANTNFYTIEQVLTPTRLILAAPYAEDTGSGNGYHIVQNAYRLAEDARELGQFWHQRLRRPLGTSSETGMGFALSSRFQISQVPAFVAEQTPDIDGVRRVEIYPYTRRSDLINYIYWRKPPDLDFKDELPAFIDVEAFREGVMVDVLRNAMWKASEAGEHRKAELLRNDYRAQETKWKNDHRHRVIKKDSGASDREFLLLNSRNHPTGVGATADVIDDAWSQVWYGRGL